MPYDDAEPRSPDGEGASGKPAEPSADTSAADKSHKEAEQARKRRRPFVIIILVTLAVLAIAAGLYWWLSTRNLISTDDAYTDGRAVTVSAKVGGYVTELLVEDNQRVRAGQVLLRIDARDLLAARDQARGQLAAVEGQVAAARVAVELTRVTAPAKLATAQAQLVSAQAVLAQAQADYRRQTGVSLAATSRQNVDQATAAQRQALASVSQAEAAVRQAEPVQLQIDQSAAQVQQLEGQLAQAQAQLAQAELNLSYATVGAPQDGWITKRNVERGDLVTAGASLLSLVTPDVWVTANFKENQLAGMRPGQSVDISIDAYPEWKVKGHVESWQLGSGSKFTAFPPENATGNYVKIVQRVPVKIVIDSGLDRGIALPLGVSVTPTVTLQ